ncbi:Methyltransferase domain-containing protein [Halomicrobium zhouii]|uniref:Methyltransferase domain-containing protein n=1 Tax=Halomicrobium zhouii TaxID=767519 RepID=A0A1I6L542_9EURY|nr:class I SAM-dependent methyltransferase [Halomicrobium zhouii]SFR98380.1 Methyltransferase domain-containing protein [Halomicrobium zhouii]
MADDTGYRGDAARLYDRQVSVSDRDDAGFYRERAKSVDGPALELACGTGRVYLELLRAGVDVDGIDLSSDVLDVLREKVDDEGLEPSVWQADMTEFTVDREYDLIYCPFNSVQHLRTADDQLGALESVYDALAPGGQFVFDVFVPSFDLVCEEYGEWQSEDVEFDGEPHTFRTRTQITDEVEQWFSVENELHRDEELVFEERLQLTFLPKRELELLARISPFDSWDVAGGFDGEPIEDGDTTQVWTMEKSV